MAGRKRIPNALHELHGLPGKRPLPKEPDLPKASDWETPDYLKDDGLQEWDRVMPLLKASKVLSETDYQVLAAYCYVVQEMTSTARSGAPVKSATLQQFRALASELGLTPASRSKVALVKEEVKPDDAFFAV